jgi:hypothetical protein
LELLTILASSSPSLTNILQQEQLGRASKVKMTNGYTSFIMWVVKENRRVAT